MIWTVIPILMTGSGVWWIMLRMPGPNYTGMAAPLMQQEIALRDSLRSCVQKLAGEIGQRNLTRYSALSGAAEYLENSLASAGYKVERDAFDVSTPGVARRAYNLIAELRGSRSPQEIVIVGAHYDSAEGTPGANDNASGTAAVLALARAFADQRPSRTLRFVLFTNEEPPYYYKDSMGSLVYARRCRAGDDDVVAMLSLETIGYFSDARDSQRYPFPINLAYPSTGNFLGLVGNIGSSSLVRNAIGSFRRAAQIPSEGVAAPAFITGIGWSDHWSFWQQGYPGIMITDTAIFRYPHYHEPTDTPEKLDYNRLTRVVEGLEAVVRDLAGAK
jgi:Zn-dependent M28 family amino/carboxypeptidase